MPEKIFSQREIVIILLIFAVLLFAFWWYELRPHFANQACLKKAEQFSMTSGQSFQQIYLDCLLRKGYN